MPRCGRRLAVLAVAGCLLVPAPAQAWGFAAHRAIAGAVSALLPAALRPLFEQYRDAFVERSADADTWRTAGFEAEAKHHFLDLDWEGFGPDPYLALPRDYDAAVAKFGLERIEQMGTLPWRVEAYTARLRDALERSTPRGDLGRFDVVLFAAWLAHYVSDAYVPLDAVVNYDGQLTGQRGVHGRFESVLFERYRDRLAVAPTGIASIARPREFVFDVLVEGTRLVPAVLAADAAASLGRREYDDAYYAAFFEAGGAVLEQRLNESIAGVAAVIAGAWEAAGRPRP